MDDPVGAAAPSSQKDNVGFAFAASLASSSATVTVNVSLALSPSPVMRSPRAEMISVVGAAGDLRQPPPGKSCPKPPVRATYGRKRAAPDGGPGSAGDVSARTAEWSNAEISAGRDPPGADSVPAAAPRPPGDLPPGRPARKAALQPPLDRFFGPRGPPDRLPRPRRRAPEQRPRPAPARRPEKAEQLTLDFGQRGRGALTCAECGMTYNRTQEADEQVHKKYHDTVVSGIIYPGYKDQVDIGTGFERDAIRVVMLAWKSTCPSAKKISDILEVVDQELGAVRLSPAQLERSRTFLAINAKQKVVGCGVALPIAGARRVDWDTPAGEDAQNAEAYMDGESDEAPPRSPGRILRQTPCVASAGPQTPPTEPAACGISRVWVSKRERSRGVATRLLDTVCRHFFYGHIIPRRSLAFSQPTKQGRRLAEKFTGRKDFLVYDDEHVAAAQCPSNRILPDGRHGQQDALSLEA